MFIQINNIRIRVASIKEYIPSPQSEHTKLWYIDMKCTGGNKLFHFDTFEKLNKVMYNLDKLLKVTSLNSL